MRDHKHPHRWFMAFIAVGMTLAVLANLVKVYLDMKKSGMID